MKKPTLRQIAALAAGATDEQLDAPIEIGVRTHTAAHATYPEAFEAQLGTTLRIYASYPEGVSVHQKKGRS